MLALDVMTLGPHKYSLQSDNLYIMKQGIQCTAGAKTTEINVYWRIMEIEQGVGKESQRITHIYSLYTPRKLSDIKIHSLPKAF